MELLLDVTVSYQMFRVQLYSVRGINTNIGCVDILVGVLA